MGLAALEDYRESVLCSVSKKYTMSEIEDSIILKGYLDEKEVEKTAMEVVDSVDDILAFI